MKCEELYVDHIIYSYITIYTGKFTTVNGSHQFSSVELPFLGTSDHFIGHLTFYFKTVGTQLVGMIQYVLSRSSGKLAISENTKVGIYKDVALVTKFGSTLVFTLTTTDANDEGESTVSWEFKGI